MHIKYGVIAIGASILAACASGPETVSSKSSAEPGLATEVSVQEPEGDNPCGTLAILGMGCDEVTDEQIAEAEKHPLGSPENPVRVGGVRASYEYLDRLRCPDGRRLKYERIGSFGSGPYGNIIDGYQYECRGGLKGVIYIDMYHPGHVEKRPVPGLVTKDQT